MKALQALLVDINGGRQRHGLDRLSGGALDRAQHAALARGDEQDRLARSPGPAGAADAVDVGLGVVGNVVVDDVADALDVQPARGHVGGDQDVDIPALEPIDDFLALLLRHVAVECGGRESARFEPSGEFLGGHARAREHQHRVERLDLQDPGQRVELVHAADHPVALVDAGRRGGLRADRDVLGIAQVSVGDTPDRVGHGGRKQHLLAALGNPFQDLPDFVDKAHAQHFVGLVEHQGIERIDPERALFQVIDDPPGRADDDIGAAPEPGQLRPVGLATVDRQHMETADV